MLYSNRCDQASSTASTRDVTPPSISEGSNLVVLSASRHCLCYIGIIPCRRRGSKESFSKRNNGQFGKVDPGWGCCLSKTGAATVEELLEICKGKIKSYVNPFLSVSMQREYEFKLNLSAFSLTAPTRAQGLRAGLTRAHRSRPSSLPTNIFKPHCTAAASPPNHSTLYLDSMASLHLWSPTVASPRAHCLVSAESSNPQQWFAFVAQSVFFLCSISSFLPPFYRLSHDESPHRLRLHLLHDSRRRHHKQVADVLRVAALTSARAMTACPEALELSLLTVAAIS
uniref:Uncharacterized protein n=1 Tax=Brassica campestris TaxID=3711 RepID=M4FFK7_BRACM